MHFRKNGRPKYICKCNIQEWACAWSWAKYKNHQGKSEKHHKHAAFQKIPPGIVVELVYSCALWLNAFPNRDGVSQTSSSRTMVTGQLLDYNQHCALDFGSYVQVHEEHDNGMSEITSGAIALWPTGRSQGGYYFYCLSTGKRLNRYKWGFLTNPYDACVANREILGS